MLAAAVDIRRWLQADRSTPQPERLARDRIVSQEMRDEVQMQVDMSREAMSAWSDRAVPPKYSSPIRRSVMATAQSNIPARAFCGQGWGT